MVSGFQVSQPVCRCRSAVAAGPTDGSVYGYVPWMVDRGSVGVPLARFLAGFAQKWISETGIASPGISCIKTGYFWPVSGPDYFRTFIWSLRLQKKGFPGFGGLVRVSTAKSGRRSDASTVNTPLLKNGAEVKPEAPFPRLKTERSSERWLGLPFIPA